MCGVSVRGNRPGSHKGVFCEPGAAGKPPLPNGKMACQQPSDGAAPGAGQLLSGDAWGPDALTWPLQLRVKTATSATTTACARGTRMQPRYPRLISGTLSAAVCSSSDLGGSQGVMGWNERSSSVPGRTVPAADSGTSFQAPGRSPSGSDTTNRVSSPKLLRISTSGCN
jgi:hypothetical protein